MNYSRRQAIRIMAQGTLLYSIVPFGTLHAGPQYGETIAALKFLHGVEESVHRSYLSYVDKAQSETYYGISNLFKALALAEKIHANKFRDLLSELKINEPPELVIEDVNSTKKNLENAIDTELYHIEMVYPSCLEDIKDENKDNIIQYITYAWQSEMIHRKLLKKMKSGMGFFFGTVAKRIEKITKKLFICPFCGSIYEQESPEQCWTCCNSDDNYIFLNDGQLIL